MSYFHRDVIFIVVLFTTFLSTPSYSYGIIVHAGPRCTMESIDVKRCVNVYMEKNYSELSRIMYPNRSENMTNAICHKRSDFQTMALEGPELHSSCGRLHGIYDCLKDELEKCDQLGAFFGLRHLLYSLKKILIWLCGDPNSESVSDDLNQELRDRFLVLLESAQCLECLRLSTKSPCYQSNNRILGDSHLWLQILRLQLGPEICQDLEEQIQCIQSQKEMVCCDEKAIRAHSNITNIFIQTWCHEHPFRLEFINNGASSTCFKFNIVDILCTRSLSFLVIVIRLLTF